MAAQVLLQVQDRQRITLVQRQQLAKGGIGLDRLLVHQVVGTRIRHHTLGHGRAAHLSVLGLAKEGAQLGGDLHGLGEDAGLGLSTLNGLYLALAAAIGLLGKARSLLLNHLERGSGRAEGGLQAGQLLVKVGDGLLERGTDVLLGGDGRLSGGRRHNGGRHNRRGNRGSSLGLRGLGLRGLRGRRRGGGSNNRDSHNGLSRLHGLLGSLDGRTHFGVIGGSN